VQTLSSTYCNALHDLAVLADAGVTSFRLSPHGCDMVAVAGLFRRVLDRQLAAEEAGRSLTALLPEVRFANGFLTGPCGAAFQPVPPR
jgi:collagenase-like PrtC family protease